MRPRSAQMAKLLKATLNAQHMGSLVMSSAPVKTGEML
jgi:hypothetical protein